MPYAQIEVSAPRHHKVAHLSSDGFRLWVTGLCYCQEHLTDGLIQPDALATMLPRKITRRAVVDELVTHGLWDADPKGWRVHDYLTWNETRDQVEARRAKWRARRGRTKPPSGPGDGTRERTPERTQGTHPSVHGGVHGTLRSATLRSTDQDQEHRPDGRTRQLRLERQQAHKDPGPPDFKRLCVIAAELFDVVGFTEPSADASEALKARCARLGIAYDSDHVWRALEAQAAARRKRA